MKVRLTGRRVPTTERTTAIPPGQAKVLKFKIKPRKTGRLTLKARVTSTNAGGKTVRKVVKVLGGKN
ncbi:MAG TPA: hypothetical protein VMF31_10455 [Solirubrobacterales bacterium]|nr:hypothetical protein [Solirubrobacterales bacterium]